MSGPVPTYEIAPSWQPYSAAQLGNQATSTMTQYPTQLRYFKFSVNLFTSRRLKIVPEIIFVIIWHRPECHVDFSVGL